MYFDWTYVVLVLPAVLFAGWASHRVNSTYARCRRQLNSRGISGSQAARFVLDRNGLQGVRIEHVAGSLTDHYDPEANVIRLSDDVFTGTSTAAVGVACHEAGHAIQYAQGYGPIKLRAAILPVSSIGAKLSMPLIILGLIMSILSPKFTVIAYAGIACFGLATLFQLVTLPTEFNASRRALVSIESGNLLSGSELEGAKKVLSAAALTYVAALAVSLMQLLRFLLIFHDSRD